MGCSPRPPCLGVAAVQETVGGVCCLSPLQSVSVWVSGSLVAEVEADVARTMFSCFGAIGGMFCLWSEEGGELKPLCASFLHPETEVRFFWL